MEFSASWRCRTTETKYAVVAVVHDLLIKRATPALSASSVFCVDSALVRLLGAISHIETTTLSEVPIEIRATAKLRVSSASYENAARRRRESFLRKAQLEDERGRLEFMRDVIFGDAALGRIWWILQRPDLVSAIGNSLFIETLEAAASARIARSTDTDGDHVVKVLADFVQWLESGDGRTEMAFGLFDALLKTLQQENLRSRLNAVRPVGGPTS